MNGKIYRITEVVSGFFVLNLLWLVACLPVITIFPATAAMFGVVREWSKDSGWSSVESFIRYFKANFLQSLLIGLLWTVFGAILLFDFYAALQMDDWLQLTMFLLLGIGVLIYSLTSMYLFPVMVNYEASWQTVLRNAFLIAVSQLGKTFLCLVIVFFMLILVLYLPVTLFFAGSVTAYLVYTVCRRGFDRIEALKGLSKTDDSL
ncbi:MAG: DUF624 domain-containing protein [Chloroflexota bacterium]